MLGGENLKYILSRTTDLSGPIPPTPSARAPPSDAPRVATVLESIYFKFSLGSQTFSGFEKGGNDCVADEHFGFGNLQRVVFKPQ